MSTFSNVQHGCLPEGTVTPLGAIDAVSLTAYRIGGRWVAFSTINGAYAPAEPLGIVG